MLKVPSFSGNSLSDTHLVQQTGKLCQGPKSSLVVDKKQTGMHKSCLCICIEKKHTGFTFAITILKSKKILASSVLKHFKKHFWGKNCF